MKKSEKQIIVNYLSGKISEYNSGIDNHVKLKAQAVSELRVGAIPYHDSCILNFIGLVNEFQGLKSSLEYEIKFDIK